MSRKFFLLTVGGKPVINLEVESKTPFKFVKKAILSYVADPNKYNWNLIKGYKVLIHLNDDTQLFSIWNDIDEAVIAGTSKEEMSTITITFGDAGENHVGMQQLGQKLKQGFTYEELKKVSEMYSNDSYKTELVDLEKFLPEEYRNERTQGASILIIRNILPSFELSHEDMFEFLKRMKWDSRFWSQKHGRVVNKIARHNFCVADFSQKADLVNKKGTVHDFKDLPCLEKIRSNMALVLGDRVSKFIAEGNYYYDSSSCGIGYHGDMERRCVIAFRFGKEMPLCYQWYINSNKVGSKISFVIGGGDAYIMSDIAVGHDWKLKKIPTLRHAAGCSKYTK